MKLPDAKETMLGAQDAVLLKAKKMATTVPTAEKMATKALEPEAAPTVDTTAPPETSGVTPPGKSPSTTTLNVLRSAPATAIRALFFPPITTLRMLRLPGRGASAQLSRLRKKWSPSFRQLRRTTTAGDGDDA